jgi:ketosteroid isomerase-like protein
VTDQKSTALDVAKRYFDAWTSKDMDSAMALVADDMVCDAPAGRLRGAAEFRAFLEPFTGILLEARLLAAYGDETKALIMYDTTTMPVPSAPGAELLTVMGGLIVANTFIFDRAPFDAARRAASASAADSG